MRVTANNALQTAARFAVFDEGGTLLEQWTMAVGVAGFVDHTIGTPPAQLARGALTWGMIVCAYDSSLDSGTVEVFVAQGGQLCELSPTGRYDLAEIPFCGEGLAIPITDELVFDG